MVRSKVTGVASVMTKHTAEPVFGHIAGIKKLNRFTLRGKQKLNTQWLLYCPGRLFYNLLGLAAHMVHNIGKVRIEWS